jgi:hypothetical protein
MAISEDHAVIADHGPPAVAGTPVYRYKFADGRIVPDLNGRVFAIELKILGISGNNRPRKDPAVLSNPGAFHYRNIASDPGTSTNLNIFMNHCEGVHLYIGREAGIRMDGRERVDRPSVN